MILWPPSYGTGRKSRISRSASARCAGKGPPRRGGGEEVLAFVGAGGRLHALFERLGARRHGKKQQGDKNPRPSHVASMVWRRRREVTAPELDGMTGAARMDGSFQPITHPSLARDPPLQAAGDSAHQSCEHDTC